MTTFNTGNPLGSTAPKDLFDNAENLDIATNDRTKREWLDRLGKQRRTMWGMEEDFQDFLIKSGYENIGDYASGLEITARNQIFWRDGELYRAGAVLELPYTTTGDWGAEEGLFVAAGDAALRQELANGSDPDSGAAMVGRSIIAMDNITSLSLAPQGGNHHISIKGYLPSSDVGGGLFYWNATNLKTNHDGGLIIDPLVNMSPPQYVSNSPGTGVWERIYDGPVKDEWYGNKADAFSIASSMVVNCWGDSLTAGTGGLGTTYPEVLKSISAFRDVINLGVGGETSTEIKLRFDAAPAAHSTTTIIWAGRNNFNDEPTVLADISGMISQLQHGRFLVLSILNSESQVIGTAGYDEVKSLNDSLARRYPRNYVDVRSYLINNALSDLGISPTPTDIANIADDIIPDSIRADNIHINSEGYTALGRFLRPLIYDLYRAQSRYSPLAEVLQALDGSLTTKTRATIFEAFNSAGSVRAIASGSGQHWQFSAALLPSFNKELDIGGSSFEWRNGTFSGTVRAEDFRIGAVNGALLELSPDATGIFINKHIYPRTDNLFNLGFSSLRFKTIYAATGTISTSDAREKTPIRELSASEVQAAKALSKEIGTYKWLASVREKADDARIHIGMTVQRAIEIMRSFGLDPFDYGFICYDKWEGLDGFAAGDKYSFRMDQLLAFIAAGLEARLTALEED